jgi:ABC-type lipoprotein release transport system permease subunit
MNIVKLAWRNLWRRLLAVTFTGTGDYAYTNMINAGADMGLGHVTIEPLTYNDSPALDKWLTDATQIREQVLKLPGVDDAMIRIMGQAMFASARKSIGGMFVAIDPQQESEAHNLFIRSMIEGELFPSTEGRGIVVGSRITEKLGLKLGKKLVYTTSDANGEIVSAIARIQGVFKTGVKEIDGAMVLLPIDSVRKTLNYDADDATFVSVLVKDQRYSQKIKHTVEQHVGDAQREVLSWKETQPDLAGLIAIDRSGNYISQLLISLLIAAGILNTLLMSVMERTREFGVMMAVGLSPRRLFQLIMTESVWLALVGLIVGIIITIPWYLYLYHVGLDFSGAIGDDYSAGGVLVDPVIHIRLYRESIIAILSGVFVLTLVSGLYPAWRATRTPPVESLKTL